LLRKSYALDQSPLYQLQSRKRLATDVFNTELALLERLAANTTNFRVFCIEQGGKQRQVEVPKAILERLHRRLFALLERIYKPPYLHSGVKRRSYLTNAQAHVGNVPLVKVDLKRFYPSVTGGMVYRFFYNVLRCSPDVAGLLTKLCVYDGHVPTGSCVSQLLAFFAVKPLFDEIEALAAQNGVRFTVYVDDMTFSGLRATPDFLWRVKQLVHAHGLKYHKDRFYPAGARKVVTGVLVDGDRLAVQPSKELAMWRQMQALGSGEAGERLAAIESLLGSAIAASQIEARFLERVRSLRGFHRQASKASTLQH